MQEGLTLEQIRDAQDIKVKAVEVPEWGGTVYVKSFSGKVREAYILTYYDVDKKDVKNVKNIQVKLIALCLCDANGVLIFDESEGSLEILAAKSAKVIDTLFQEASELNGIGDEDLKGAEKNL